VVEVERAPTVDLDALASAFNSDHSRMFGYSRPELELELLHCRVRARGIAGVTGPLASNPAERFPGPAPGRTRSVYLPERGGRVPVPVYDADGLQPGAELLGPLIVSSPTTTILVPAGCTLSVPHAEAFLLELGRPD
jgi:N-methylhydantoinase A